MAIRRVLAVVTTALAVAAGAVVPAGAANAADATRHNSARFTKVGYFTQWGIYSGFFPKNLVTNGTAPRLTHVNYAFGNVDSTGKCASFDPFADWQRPYPAAESVDGVADSTGLAGNFNQIRKLKKKNPKLKVLISLGGWTGSKFFSDAVLTAESRRAMVTSCVDLFVKGNLPGLPPGAAAGVFDGIDLDWEWPGSEGAPGNIVRAQDKQNFTLAVAEFRRQLDAYGRRTHKDYQLTAFLPADPKQIDNGFEVRKLFRHFDFVTVQGYDMHGSWDPITNHQSALYPPAGQPVRPDFTVSRAVNALIERGAPKRRLVVGVPFYSRGWTDVASPTNNGLYQPAPTAAPPDGYENYKVIKTLPAKGFKVHYDLLAGHAWLFDGKTFWTYDDPIVVFRKMLYIRHQGLGGAMVWSLDGDDDRGSLYATIDLGLR